MTDTLAPPDPHYERSWLGLLNRGFEGANASRDEDNPFINAFRQSIVGDLFREGGPAKSEYAKVFGMRDASAVAKANYVLGRVLHDVIVDGTRTPYWLMNHPLGLASVLSSWATKSAGVGLSGSRKQELMRQLEIEGEDTSIENVERRHAAELGFGLAGGPRGAPLRLAEGVVPLLTSGVLTQMSQTTDWANLAQGGRARGYEAVLASEDDKKQTTNTVGELALRYITGRSGRLLPWEEFTVERPDVSRADYEAARIHQFDKGLFGIGLIKGTGRNLEGEPEATAMGFRVPLSAAATAAGGLIGSVQGAKIVDNLLQKERQRRVEAGIDEPIPVLQKRGHGLVAGQVAGLLAGGLLGNLGSRVVNEAVIQPNFYPERKAAQDLWEQSLA
jgi:hypothetical protein